MKGVVGSEQGEGNRWGLAQFLIVKIGEENPDSERKEG